MRAVIKITFWTYKNLGDYIDVLMAADWKFGRHSVNYKYFTNLEDQFDNCFDKPVSELDQIKLETNEYLNAGNIVQFEMNWHEEYYANLEFSVNEIHETTLELIIDSTRPKIDNFGNYTDYSWFVKHLVYPFDVAECGILEVNYHDDFS